MNDEQESKEEELFENLEMLKDQLTHLKMRDLGISFIFEKFCNLRNLAILDLSKNRIE